MKNIFKVKNILVTGGAGSIGSEIVKQILIYRPKVVRVFDNNETGLFNLEHEMKSYNNLRFLVGDVRDKNRLKRAMEEIDIVFHAAALKHVPSCEYNPFEAVQTNVVGTQNVIDAALGEEVDKFLNISTDKAVNPYNVMGATKLLTERLTTSANLYKGRRKTVLSSVRFGNVVASRGSVLKLFLEQIRNGGPITITNPEMTRFIMTIQDSIKLVFKSAELAKGGEVFIFKMPAFRLGDFADVIINEFASKYNHEPHKIKIRKIGNRPGEKMHEELMTEDEARRSLETKYTFILLPDMITNVEYTYPNAIPAKIIKYSSKDAKILSKVEIRDLLKKI